MRKNVKIVLAVIVIVFVTILAFGSEFTVVVPSSVNQETSQALAVDTSKTRITAELKDAITKTASDVAINIWVEFDSEEYERRTNSSIFSLRKYYDSAAKKIMDNMESGYLKNKLLPEEIIATIFFYGKGVEPPVEIAKPYLTWYYSMGLTSESINSIVDFPGLEEIDLRTLAEDPNGKADPILMSLVTKTAKEYPTYKIRVFIDVNEQPNPETGAFSYNLEQVDQIILKYGGQIVSNWTNELQALIPPSFQLIAELSSLGEVTSIFPNWDFYALD